MVGRWTSPFRVVVVRSVLLVAAMVDGASQMAVRSSGSVVFNRSFISVIFTFHAPSNSNFRPVSVQLPIRTPKTWHYPHLLLRAVLRPRAAAAPAVQQSIDICYATAGPTAANPPHAAAAGEWGRQTNGRRDRQTCGHRTVT